MNTTNNLAVPEWLGNIPSGWTLTTVGSVFDERNEKVMESDYQPLSVTMGGVVPQLSSAVKAAEDSDRKLVRAGDFVINSRSDRRGACGISPVDGSCSVINIVIHPRNKQNAKYYSYALLSERFPEEFYRWGHGIASDLWTTRWSEFKKIQLPKPSEAVQARIVGFLDEKCGEIDSIIRAAEISIQKYINYRQVVIEHAITKGILPDRKMKPSGDKAFGEIPEEWEMIKLRRIFAIKKNIAGEEGHQVLSITQRGIIPKDISKNEGQMAADYSGYQLVAAGDFAMNHMDLLTGWVDISAYDGVTSPDYRVFYIKDASKYCKEYYLYLLQLCYSKQIFYSMAQGVSEFGRCRLKADKFLHFEIMLPPYEEQVSISNYLKTKVGEIDRLINEKEQLIDTMKAYKKAIIYEYVTGKKEVPACQ